MSEDAQKKTEGKRYLVIRIRGLVNIKAPISETMEKLCLYRRNYCAIISEKNLGMIKKVKDYVTYGEIDKETETELINKKGEKKKNHDGSESLKKFFRLNPPKGGFERKGIKVAYSQKGALGYRGNKIVDLLKRML